VVEVRRTSLPSHDGAQLYGPLLFHGRMYQRLRRYEHLAATGCTAVLSSQPHPAWRCEPAGAEWPHLGDPGRNDASIHVLQACVPHRRLLPVGCDQFTVHQSAPPGQDGAGDLVLAAVERAHVDGIYTYDVAVRDGRAQPVLSWRGLRLRDVGPNTALTKWPKLLVEPYLQRAVDALLPDAGPRLVSAYQPVAQQAELDTSRLLMPWTDQADLLAKLTGESDAHVLTRLCAARLCLSKIGVTRQPPLVVHGAFEHGWIVLKAGMDSIASVVLRIEGEKHPVAVAVLAKGDECCPTSSMSTL